MSSDRGEGLAAQIAANPDDDSAYLVYADWLQANGDPLGELIIFDHRIARGETDLVPARWQYLDRHRGYLLGEMAHRVDLFERSPRKLGCMRAVPREDLGRWLRAPVARFVTTIVAEGDDAIAALEACPARPPLRSVALQCSRERKGLLDLDWLWPRVPHLERFELDGTTRLDAIDLPRARQILFFDSRTIGLDAKAVASFARASWPVLESLRLGFVGQDKVLAPLLDGTHLPGLRHLAIHHYAQDLDALGVMIAGAPIVAQLRYLELSGWSRLEGAAAVAIANAADRFRHLEVFDITLGKRIRTRDRPLLRGLIKPDPARLRMREFANGF